MAEEEDYSALPLDQRLTHKIWKVRLGAYNDLTSVLKRLDPETEAAQFNKYENYLTKMILDTNMAAQEAGISTAIVFINYAPNPTRYREEIISGVVSKCLAATKASTRTQSVELLLLLSEVDTPGPVVTGVIDGFDAKQPKAAAAAVAAARQIVHVYGVKFINIKQLLKALAKPFAHKDKSVRAETQLLAVELFRWMGQAIMPFLQDLSPVLLKDLEAQFEKAANDPPPRQERMLRSQLDIDEPSAPVHTGSGVSTGQDDGDDGGGPAESSPGMDAWDLADAVDITSRLPDDFYQFIVSTKWKERKQAVEELHETLKKAIRLQFNSGTGDVIQELGKKIGDTNIIVATLVIQCLGLFASALRQPFSPYVQSTLPALVEKSKERKQSVVDAIRETMDSCFAAAGFDLTAIGDHYFTGATHKNPQVRAESNHFLRRCFAVVPKRPGKTDIRRYSDQLKTGLEDGDANVREAAAECLGTLSKLVTPKALDPFIEGVDKIKLDKINEYSEKATVKAKAAPKPQPPSAAATGNARPKPRAPGAAPGRQARAPPRPAPAAVDEKEDSGSGAGIGANLPPHIRKKLEASARAAALKKAQREGRTLDETEMEAADPANVAKPKAAAPPPKRLAASAAPRKVPAAATGGGTSARAGSKGKAPGGKGASEAIKMLFANDETLDEKIASSLPEDVLTSFASAKWKDRMDAMDQLKEYLGDQAASGSPVHPELIIRQLARKPGWKESNFQVNTRAFQIIEWMASEDSLEFNTGAAALCVPALVDKLGDIKLKSPASNALIAIAERYTLKFVIGLAEAPIRNQKSPKVLADCMAWLDTQLLEFGISGLALRPIINMVKDVGLQSSNALTRTKAVTFIGTVRRAVGPSVMDLIDDLNPQLLQLVEAEFEKVGDQPMPDPIHTQRGLSGASESGGTGGGSGAAEGDDGDGDDPMDDLFPRQDLNLFIGPAVYKKLGDSNWKERKAALDQIHNALESAKHRIQPNISSDLYAALKLRLQDSNKNLIAVALGLLGTLSTDSNSAPAANIRIVALQTIHCLSDKKVQVRSAALTALSAWAAASSTTVDQAVLPAVPNALGDNSPELRSSLLRWVADTLGLRQAKGGRLPDLSTFFSPLFSCLQDRTVEVRKQATRVLSLVISSCGFEAVHDVCTMQLHGAALNTVLPMIEEFRNTIGNAPAASNTAASGVRARPSGAAAQRGLSTADRAASPVPEPVMTASELLGRTPGGNPRTAPPMSSAGGNGTGPAATSGAGMLRRPMAVRRPAGAAAGIGAGLSGMRQARPMRGPSSSTESSRPGSSLRTATPAALSMVNQLARMSSEELESIPPVLDCDYRAKEQRGRRDMAANPHGIPKWSLLSDSRMRADLEAQLKDQMGLHFNPLIHKLLFSNGHYKDRDFLSGLTTIEEVISITSLSQQRFGLPLHSESPDEDSLASRYMANIDLLLKYISVRMYDGSTHTLLKSFDLLEHLVHMVEATQHQQAPSWSDYEVQAVLPALISRLGDAKEVVRARSRRLLTQLITHLYPTTKLFITLLEHGVQNRNNSRIRQEALDSICYLIRERTAGLGLNAVCSHPDRAVPIIVKCIADRDSSVRAAALNAMVAMGEQLPGGADELWRYSGRMDPKERVMLEEKLKRSSIGLGSASTLGNETTGQRPGSRIGMGQPAGVRARAPQYGAPVAAGSRMGTGIGRPANMAGAGGIARSSIGGTGTNRQIRPTSMTQPSSHYAMQGNDMNARADYGGTMQQQQPLPASAQFGGGSASNLTNAGKPMFTLDFDNLRLPSYSTATKDQLGSGHSTSTRASTTGAAPVSSFAGARDANRSPNMDYSENTGSAIGYGAGRSDNYRSALSAIHSNRDTASTVAAIDHNTEMIVERARANATLSGSPAIGTAAAGRPMSMMYGSTHGPGDFTAMSDIERIQWLDCVVSDLKSESLEAIEKAVERIQGLLSTVEQESPEEDSHNGGQTSSPALMHIRKNIERIIMALVAQIHWSYTVAPGDPSLDFSQQQLLSRVHRATLTLLIDMFSNRDVAVWVPLAALRSMLEELIRRIVDPALKPDDRSQERSGGIFIENAEQIGRGLNTLIIKALDNSDRTSVYTALINLLDLSMAEGSPNPPQTDDQVLCMEFGEMAMKCLWRTTKPLTQILYMQFMDAIDSHVALIPHEQAYPRLGGSYVHPVIRVDRMLHASHAFFEHVPDSEWRKRENRDVWMFGDLPKRTVKTINHSITSALHGLVWQFTGLIIRDVMEKHPGLIAQPSEAVLAADETTLDAADPEFAGWLDDTHRKLLRVSETWTYLSTTLSLSNEELGRPTLAQLVSAFRESQIPDPDEQQSGVDTATYTAPNDHRHGGTPQQPQLPSRPGSVMSTSSSPYQQQRILSQSSAADRAQSPAFAPNRASHLYAAASNRASSPLNSGSEYPRSMHSPPQQQQTSAFGQDASRAAASRGAGASDNTVNQERLNALRERILGNRASSQSNQDPQPQQPPGAPMPPTSTTSRLPPRLAGPSDSVPNMEDIRQKIALMRNSLRSQK
ncbi:hypothetical protein EV178_000448 [Coemansia sp. RSA 1646]|nr:hypothetical protein EV178_000448 [Coemansia sp. RSA 1646]KAJ2093744.1 hypothetical protein IW138_000140 [Coemansia sp. RSA 986]